MFFRALNLTAGIVCAGMASAYAVKGSCAESLLFFGLGFLNLFSFLWVKPK